MRRVIVLAVVAVLALPGLAFAAEPLPPGPGTPGPIAEVYWRQVRSAHLSWSRAVVAASSPARWSQLASLRRIHPALADPGCNNTIPALALERMAANALRLAAVRRGDGADRTAHRYVVLAGDYARDAVRNMPARCVR